MGKNFILEMETPEREFFEGEVEAVVVTGLDGQIQILAGHVPMVAGIAAGPMRFCVDGKWRTLDATEGFLEVRPGRTVIFAQTMHWPHEIDEYKEQEAVRQAQEAMRQGKSMQEYAQSQVALSRALTRLKLKRDADGRL